MRLIDIHPDGMPPWLQRKPHNLLDQGISDPKSAARDIQEAPEDLAAVDLPMNTPDPDRGVTLLAMHDADVKCAATSRDLLVFSPPTGDRLGRRIVGHQQYPPKERPRPARPAT
jgi:hypothetical protein